MRDVAKDAGVSERTLYYHYPSRHALLDGLNGWVREQLEEKRLQADPREVEDLPGRIGAIFAAFEEIGAPARAMARLSAVMGPVSRIAVIRTDRQTRKGLDLIWSQIPSLHALRLVPEADGLCPRSCRMPRQRMPDVRAQPGRMLRRGDG